MEKVLWAIKYQRRFMVFISEALCSKSKTEENKRRVRSNTEKVKSPVTTGADLLQQQAVKISLSYKLSFQSCDGKQARCCRIGSSSTWNHVNPEIELAESRIQTRGKMEPRAKSHSVEGRPIQATFLRHERKEDLQFCIPQSDFWLQTSCFGSVMVFAWLCTLQRVGLLYVNALCGPIL